MKGFSAVILNLFQDPAINKRKSSAWILKQVQYDHTIKGFTLIELLVVVLIIGILSAVALPQYQRAVAKTRVAELVAQTNALWRAQQLYFLENGTYTENMDDLTLSLPAGCEKTAGNSYVCGHISYGSKEAGGWRAGGSSMLLHINYYRYLGDLGQQTAYCQIIGNDLALGRFLCVSLGGVEFGTAAGRPLYRISL